MLSPSALTSIESETSALLFKIKFSESGMSHLLESLIGANWKKAEEFDDPARSDGILGVHSTSPGWVGPSHYGVLFRPPQHSVGTVPIRKESCLARDVLTLDSANFLFEFVNQSPLSIMLACGIAFVVGRFWYLDYQEAGRGKEQTKAIPGATPAGNATMLIAVLGSMLILAIETAGEYALEVSQEQSTVTVLFLRRAYRSRNNRGDSSFAVTSWWRRGDRLS